MQEGYELSLGPSLTGFLHDLLHEQTILTVLMVLPRTRPFTGNSADTAPSLCEARTLSSDRGHGPCTALPAVRPCGLQ